MKRYEGGKVKYTVGRQSSVCLQHSVMRDVKKEVVRGRDNHVRFSDHVTSLDFMLRAVGSQ